MPSIIERLSPRAPGVHEQRCSILCGHQKSVGDGDDARNRMTIAVITAIPRVPAHGSSIAAMVDMRVEQRAIYRGAVVAGQFDNPGLDDETAEFDQVPRPLGAYPGTF